MGQIILTLILFLVVKECVWTLTEGGKIPEYLKYKPWSCNKCLGFWSLLAIYGTVAYAFALYITAIVGTVLTILDTIAYIIHEKQNTLTIEEYDKMMENKQHKDR